MGKVKAKPTEAQPKIFQLLVESLDHAKLTPSKKEFARAVLRHAVEYACMRQAGYTFEAKETPAAKVSPHGG